MTIGRCVYAIKHKPEKVFHRLQSVDPEDVCISSVTYAELVHGVEKSAAVEKNRLAQTILFREWMKKDADLSCDDDSEEYVCDYQMDEVFRNLPEKCDDKKAMISGKNRHVDQITSACLFSISI